MWYRNSERGMCVKFKCRKHTSIHKDKNKFLLLLFLPNFIGNKLEDYKYATQLTCKLYYVHYLFFVRMSDLLAFPRMSFLLLCILGMILVTSGFPQHRLHLRCLLTKCEGYSYMTVI